MRVMVTGGAGFIGSTLVDRLLAEGHSVDVVDDLSRGSLANLQQARSLGEPFTFQHLDIRLPELIDYVSRRRPEVIFHLAAQPVASASLARPIFDADVNVVGSLRVFEAALGVGCKKVIAAADGGALYGDGSDDSLPFREDRWPMPSSPFAVAKWAMIEYLKIYRMMFGLDFTVLAPSNVYGPRQSSDADGGVVAIFTRALASGQAPPMYGDGHQTRDFVFVDDVVDAFVRAMNRGSGLVMNVGTARETSIRELYITVARATNSRLNPTRAPRRVSDLRRIALDSSRAKRELGWASWTSLEEGIELTLAHMGAS